MRNILQYQVPLFAAALWWGSLCAIGFLTVPLLFSHLPTAAIAGQMAAKLFSATTWLSLACCFVLIFAFRPARQEFTDEPVDPVQEASARVTAAWALSLTAWILGGALLALLSEFAVAPRIIARENLPLWHAVGTGMYAAQWVCATVVLWRLAARLQWPR